MPNGTLGEQFVNKKRGRDAVLRSDIIKASTQQKCGKKVPQGPKKTIYNKQIEEELDNYRLEIEKRFEKSQIRSYNFLRSLNVDQRANIHSGSNAAFTN